MIDREKPPKTTICIEWHNNALSLIFTPSVTKYKQKLIKEI
jgi:hypothetical protein